MATGFGGIDFNPEPAQGSNPFDSVTQGLNLGFGIQNQLREQQKFQMEKAVAAAKAQQEKEKMKIERGEKGLTYLKEFGKDLSPEVKTKIVRDSIIPLANKLYGLNVDPSAIEYKDEYGKLLNLMVNKAPLELIKEEYALLVSKSNKDSLPVVKELGETAGVGESSPDGLSAYQKENLYRQSRLDAGKLRTEFINRPEVKEFVTIDTQVKSMDSLLNKALAGDSKNKLALDQALISMFNKLTDPSSVVRESEYARTPENLPVVNKLLGGIKKLEEGGAGLTDADRKALVLGAKIIANERGAAFNARRNEYTSLATDVGADPGIVTRTIRESKPYEVGAGQTDSAPQEITSKSQYDSLPSGAIYRYGGKTLRKK